MRILRTPESRFAQLPDYPFAPHWHELEPGFRIHYVDEGPREAAPVLMLHGEPSWSYLYRHMIPPVASAGLRVLAPDMPGFGKSDKPASRRDYSYARQVEWMRRWVDALDLREITLVCQDWGSLIGLRVLAAMPERFARVVISNGGLPQGELDSKAFRRWRAFSRWSPVFPIGRIVQAGTRRKLSAAEIAAYDAPFPRNAFKVATRAFPSLVPADPDDPAIPDQRHAWSVLEAWEKPFLCCFSDRDPITRGGDRELLRRIPGTRGQPHTTLHGGHFVQEDDPGGFARLVVQCCLGT